MTAAEKMAAFVEDFLLWLQDVFLGLRRPPKSRARAVRNEKVKDA